MCPEVLQDILAKCAKPEVRILLVTGKPGEMHDMATFKKLGGIEDPRMVILGETVNAPADWRSGVEGKWDMWRAGEKAVEMQREAQATGKKSIPGTLSVQLVEPSYAGS